MIYCFDLDGTLVTQTQDKEGKMHYSEALPISRSIQKLRKLHEKGHHIIIQTARGSGSGINYENLIYHIMILILGKNLLLIFI